MIDPVWMVPAACIGATLAIIAWERVNRSRLGERKEEAPRVIGEFAEQQRCPKCHWLNSEGQDRGGYVKYSTKHGTVWRQCVRCGAVTHYRPLDAKEE